MERCGGHFETTGNHTRPPVYGTGTALDAAFFKSLVSGTTGSDRRSPLSMPTGMDLSGTRLPFKEAKIAFERSYVIKILAECDGSVSNAASALGILPNNLSRKMKELGISPE